MKRLTALLLILALLCGTVSALAASTWTSPNCKHTGNTGKFCEECGEAKPAKKVTTTTSTSIKAGDYVKFGNYYQKNKDTKTPISWLVLDVDGDTLFLLSQYGLEKRQFNKSSDGTTWKNSAVRTWLNDTFLSRAFNSSERSAIQVTVVDNSASQSKSGWNSAKRAGGTTKDRIFLLSYKEVQTYLSDSDLRMCIPTNYAISQNCNRSPKKYLNGKSTCWYWLRSAAYKNNAGVVDWDGSVETCYIHHNYGVVRPALWVEVSAVTK